MTPGDDGGQLMSVACRSNGAYSSGAEILKSKGHWHSSTGMIV